jgi:hypothetical protein
MYFVEYLYNSAIYLSCGRKRIVVFPCYEKKMLMTIVPFIDKNGIEMRCDTYYLHILNLNKESNN